jgi:hypothetical protein
VRAGEELGLSDHRYFGDPVPAAERTPTLRDATAD